MADLDRIPPSTTAYVVATAIIAGVTGYFLGQGSSLGLFSTKEKEGWPNSYNVKVHRDSSDEEGDDEDDDEEEEEDSEEEGDGGELANFEGNNEEVKLVLVVRTDLGMTKGWFFFFFPSLSLFFTRSCFIFIRVEENPLQPISHTPNTLQKKKQANSATHQRRKNRRPMLPCHPRLLQIPHSLYAQLTDPAPLGTPGPSEDCAADQIRRGAAIAAGAGHQPGALRAGDTGCRTDSDRQWESHGAGGFGT
ncbi:aminoacyl-tRNA hydrolase PTH2 [Aspergillus melleus]|uniref:aminoacyl-tRNA hydrolase PTH2 n=1 Tax=Aspergillus melleus TaxID=138277 RepID=UPI001E8DFEC5|nr:uncharacterized protein LDX57_005961 [Aspergillus melleus]KAH8428258.1 hypothetical protein LDX57_005961 [Aspergillus melleus]